MGAVHTHAVHALEEQIAHQSVIDRRFRRHGNHDANISVVGDGTKKRFRVSLKQLPSANGSRVSALRCLRTLRLLAEQTVQHVKNPMYGDEDIRFYPSK